MVGWGVSKTTAISMVLLGLCGVSCTSPAATERSDAEVAPRDAMPLDASIPVDASTSEAQAKVQIYAYNPSANTGGSEVIFQYGNLIQQAMDWKLSPEGGADEVAIHLALYKLDQRIYLNTHAGTDGYGRVSGDDFAGGNSQKLIYMLVQAARAGVQVKLIYHNPSELDDVEDPSEGIRSYLIDAFYEDCRVRPTCDVSIGEGALHVHRVNWPNGKTTGQHHNKFMLVSKLGPEDRNNVYISTANADGHTNFVPSPNYVQSAVLIGEHPELYTAYRNYFEKVWAHSNDIWNIDSYPPNNGQEMHDGFLASVRDSSSQPNHSDGTLNYSDSRFQAYFYPLPRENCDGPGGSSDAWSLTHNPVAMLVERLDEHSEQNRYLKINMYHLKSDRFGNELHASIKEAFDRSTVYHLDIKAAIRKDSAGATFANFSEWGLEWMAPTHAKNYNFAFTAEQEFFVITGSTNAKWDAYCSKANTQLLIREHDVIENGEVLHPIYDRFREIFLYAY